MLKTKYKKMLLGTGYLLSLTTIALCITMLLGGIKNYLKTNPDIDYGVYGVFEKVTPVVEDVKPNMIMKPYLADTVTIGKYFYDYEGDKEEQENSIVYYQNTYMQNSGIDYISESPFDVIAILDGDVKSVKTDETLGNIIEIKHTNELISIYQGVENVKVKEGDKVSQSTIVATSGTSLVNPDYKNQLHFEIYHKGELLDPENIYNLNIEDFW